MVDHSPDQKIAPRTELEDQPSLMKSGFMKDYQLQGLSFLLWMHRNGVNCILGDEMGLGKTLQTLALFACLKERESCGYIYGYKVSHRPQSFASFLCKPYYLPSLCAFQLDKCKRMLVVLTDGLLTNAMQECTKWFPSFKVAKVHGTILERRHQKEELRTNSVDIVVTTYDAYAVEDTWCECLRTPALNILIFPLLQSRASIGGKRALYYM